MPPEPIDLPLLGRRIRVRRMILGMSREALAAESGVATSTLQSLEKGEREPMLGTVAAVAHALAVPVDELLRGEAP